MKIRRIKHKKKTLKTFAEDYDLTLVINENMEGSYFSVFFENTEVRENGSLAFPVGGGCTLVAAVTDFLETIAGKTLYVLAPIGHQRYIDVPNYVLEFTAKDLE